MNTIATTILAGAGVGLSIAAPIGPTSMLCVQRTLAAGLFTGLATGFGVATVHLVYAILAAGGGAAFAAAWTDTALLSFVSGLVLLAFAVRALGRAPVLSQGTEARRTLAGSYFGAVGLGFLNPFTPILFAAATPSLLGYASAPMPALVGGVFLGSFGWWIALSTAVLMLRRRLTCRFLSLANKAAGLLLAALACSMPAKGAIAVGPNMLAGYWAKEQITETVIPRQRVTAISLPHGISRPEPPTAAP